MTDELKAWMDLYKARERELRNIFSKYQLSTDKRAEVLSGLEKITVDLKEHIKEKGCLEIKTEEVKKDQLRTDLGNFLKKLREEKRITQEDLAKELGKITGRQVYRCERDESVPREGTLTRLARYYKINVNEFYQK